MTNDQRSLLPSWRTGPTRDAILAFLDASSSLAPDDKVAVFDNDGTLWCERPSYLQYLYYAHVLEGRAEVDPSLRHVVEFAAVIDDDGAAIAEMGLPRIALALNSLFEGWTPAEFVRDVQSFIHRTEHPLLGLLLRDVVYQPMLELIDALRDHGFAVFIVSGGGTEFVRAVSQDLYGVPPEGVVGTLVEHVAEHTADGGIEVRRTGRLDGDANEGMSKVLRIQRHLGRRPVFAAGNSGGDIEMLEWATCGDGPSLAVVIDHDDGEREFSYQSRAESFVESQTITDVANRRQWTVVSMTRDWSTVFQPADPVG